MHNSDPAPGQYIESPPELKAAKQKQNMDTMNELQTLLAAGGQCVWVAPSGGRDRPDPAAAPFPGGAEFSVAPFDAKSVELFRVMAAKAEAAARKAAEAKAEAGGGDGGGAAAVRVPQTHFFTLAMLSRKLIPPPVATGDRAVGEVRDFRGLRATGRWASVCVGGGRLSLCLCAQRAF
jgi:glycerol-3-phosphate O-acyltransferase